MGLKAIDVHGLVKPFLRGRIHAAALLAAIPAGLVLISRSSGTAARAGAVVYAITLVALFGASSAYHRLGRTERTRVVLRRLDHSSIYLLIAGSYTPLCLLALSGWWSVVMLTVVWSAAAFGIVLKLTRFDSSHRVGSALYIGMGWAVVAALPALVPALSPHALTLLIVGGLIYTVGAIVLATRFPNPFPRVFGYHEVWHLMVVVAGVLHYAAIHDVVTTAA